MVAKVLALITPRISVHFEAPEAWRARRARQESMPRRMTLHDIPPEGSPQSHSTGAELIAARVPLPAGVSDPLGSPSFGNVVAGATPIEVDPRFEIRVAGSDRRVLIGVRNDGPVGEFRGQINDIAGPHMESDVERPCLPCRDRALEPYLQPDLALVTVA